ncbi:MAG TPA: 2-oxo-4-hydroxy-4-carboxy-5-ureidoimidazoline decarboxylase [Jiangellaceae bacterium]|nr:2-oxo-4-hydroxy-4-carboxy-5-ureidoimidazoline decarboxylase [Jiangellaceae bacterium]
MTRLDGLGLAQFNALPAGQAEAALLGCCTARHWVRAVLAGRPYATVEEVHAVAAAALAELSEADIDEALGGHPRIGERAKVGHSGWSGGEQSGMATTSDATKRAMVEANREYEARFGHVYLVCASGRSGDELLSIVRDRLRNDAATERRVVRAELGKINRLRLERMLSAEEQ